MYLISRSCARARPLDAVTPADRRCHARGRLIGCGSDNRKWWWFRLFRKPDAPKVARRACIALHRSVLGRLSGEKRCEGGGCSQAWIEKGSMKRDEGRGRDASRKLHLPDLVGWSTTLGRSTLVRWINYLSVDREPVICRSVTPFPLIWIDKSLNDSVDRKIEVVERTVNCSSKTNNFFQYVLRISQNSNLLQRVS